MPDDDMIGALSDALEFSPENAGLRRLLAQRLTRRGLLKEAEAECRRAL